MMNLKIAPSLASRYPRGMGFSSFYLRVGARGEGGFDFAFTLNSHVWEVNMRSKFSISRISIGALLIAAAPYAHAQPAWKPEKSVEIIIGTSPGGPQDHLGRMLQKVLQDARLVDVPVTVENKPGGGGAVALAVLGQRSGGATLMINAPTMLNNQITGRSALPYTDFTALAVLGIEYECVAVRADSPLKTAKDLIERLKKDPAALSVSIGTSLGNSGHLAFALAMKAAGVDSTHEAWRGVIGPRGMTRAQIAFWDDVLGKVVKTDAWQKDLAQSQIENIYRNSAETVKYLKAQYDEARGILTDLGLAK